VIFLVTICRILTVALSCNLQVSPIGRTLK
jgi:hypothetical protein